MPSRSDIALASIALPARDAERWLAECIDSILAQSEPRFELLAVDDASSDRTRAILEEYASRDARVRVLETQGHARGIAHALNTALAAARTPVVVRMDADDRMHPERLARQLAALEADPSLFAVASRATVFPEEAATDGMRAYLEWQNGLVTPEEIRRDRFVESPVLHPSIAMRTEVLRDRLGGWNDGPWPEDWELFLRAFDAGLRIARTPEVLVEWRLHAEQATRTHARYQMDALLELRATHLARHLRSVAGSDRPVWVLGSGPVGKALVKALARHGVVAGGLADVDARKIGGVVRGQEYRWRVVAHTELESMEPRPFAISAVSGAVARERVRAALAAWGWTEGADFVVAA